MSANLPLSLGCGRGLCELTALPLNRQRGLNKHGKGGQAAIRRSATSTTGRPPCCACCGGSRCPVPAAGASPLGLHRVVPWDRPDLIANVLRLLHGNLRVAPETLGGEMGVEGEGVHNPLLPHGHKAHTVHEARPSTPGAQQRLDAGTVHRLVDPQDGEHWLNIRVQRAHGFHPKPPLGKRVQLHQDIAGGYQFGARGQELIPRLPGGRMPAVGGVKDRQEARCVDEDAHHVRSSTR